MTDEVMDPQKLALSVAVETSERTDAVGDFVTSIDLGDGVTDFRFVSKLVGYEGWQWSVTLYHDEELQRWTVNESTLIPTDDSLLPPPWIPWKDRLKPSDLSVMDTMGTEEDDPRLEDGFRPTRRIEHELTNSREDDEAKTEEGNDNTVISEGNATVSDGMASENSVSEDSTSEGDVSENSAEYPATDENQPEKSQNLTEQQDSQVLSDEDEDLEEAVSTLRLSRRRVMTAEALSQTAKRWYSGQHGPKSLSTKVADGKACSSCGFMIPLAGSLGSMFGVCANMWSPDDGRVVSLDHACGEHSDIEPPEPSQLWIQSAPAYDDYHIDILQQAPRDERADVELIEEAIEDSKENRRRKRKVANRIHEEKLSAKKVLAETSETAGTTDKTADAETATTTKTPEQQSVTQTDRSSNSNLHTVEAQGSKEQSEQLVQQDRVETVMQDAEVDRAIDNVDINDTIDTQQVEETTQTKNRARSTASTAMHLYKRKSRRQHK